jgi:hypothetical protein
MSKTKMSLAIAGLMLSALWTASAQSPAAGYHVTICHRTGSATNPYVVISPDVEGVVNGHMDHEQIGNGLGGDIIPTFVYRGVTYSKNLDATFNGRSGSDILAAGCRVPRVVPTPTPTIRPPGTPPPPEPVPEPMTFVLFGTGLAAIGFALRKQIFR